MRARHLLPACLRDLVGQPLHDCACRCAGMIVVLTIGNGLAASLTGSYAPIPAGSNVNLSVLGNVDWVHWGLNTAESLDRKSGVPAIINNYTLIGSGNVVAYSYSDNTSSYRWEDG